MSREAAYWQAIRDLVDTEHGSGRPKHEICEQVVHMVTAALVAGEPWATSVAQRWELAGANADYSRVFKDAGTVTYIRADGRKVRKTVGYSRPVRSNETGEVIGQQLRLWWGMSRAEIEALRDDTAIQAEERAMAVNALNLLIAAMDAHPECATAREAWEAAGHSVGEIDLRGIA